MSKESAAWLIIRASGLAILVVCLWNVYHFTLNLIFILLQAYAVAPTEAIIHLPNLRWDPMVHATALGILAFYFLRRGGLVHSWLIREDEQNGRS
ncbi:MAG: hypothetical protein GWN30_20740 [Gammaproteobacteria bacterium]|nr:hypothetical protein [Gammaproteobacteria bacterium]